jgi:hypothetical protein
MAQTIDLGAAELNMICDAGADADFTVILTDQDTGAPLNLTGATVTFAVKFGYNEPAAVLSVTSATVANSWIVITPLTGTVQVHLDALDTVTLAAPKAYVYDITVTSATATNRRLWGRFNTRATVATA